MFLPEGQQLLVHTLQVVQVRVKARHSPQVVGEMHLHCTHNMAGSWQRPAMSLPASAVQVKQWQEEQRNAAQNEDLGYVCTILGRRRLLPDASGGGRMVSSPGSLPLHRMMCRALHLRCLPLLCLLVVLAGVG